MNTELANAFGKLQTIRNQYFNTPSFQSDIHSRQAKHKWSIAESIYHCYILLRITRLTLQYYIPFARVFTKLPVRINTESHMNNIYGPKTMKSPKILIPPRRIDYNIHELRALLEFETSKIKEIVSDLSDREVYGIRLPDPVPRFPNIVQTIKLLHIHEGHHYNVVTTRALSASKQTDEMLLMYNKSKFTEAR